MRVIRKSLKQMTVTILNDLNLFSSLCIAQFIVWRTLRRNRKKREVRRERLSLVHTASADLRGAPNTYRRRNA